MLILARRPGERVVIGGDILVTVMEVSGSTVRLGIAAPAGVSIYREEIWLAVEAENRAAAAADAHALPSEAASRLLVESVSDTPPHATGASTGGADAENPTAGEATGGDSGANGTSGERPEGESPTSEDAEETGGPTPPGA